MVAGGWELPAARLSLSPLPSLPWGTEVVVVLVVAVDVVAVVVGELVVEVAPVGPVAPEVPPVGVEVGFTAGVVVVDEVPPVSVLEPVGPVVELVGATVVVAAGSPLETSLAQAEAAPASSVSSAVCVPERLGPDE